MSVEGMVAQAEQSLGLREPNHIQQWYRERNGSAFGGNFAWCNAAITYWAVQAGEHASVCFGTDYAYTVWHAQRFQTAKQWHTDVKGIRRGDIVFFDWGGTNEIARIDHIGIVTGVSGGTVYTIEGNTENVCARRARGASTIVGYGRPKYKTATTPPAAGTGTYKVKAGDTLGEIAEAHGTTVKILADLNGIKDPNKIGAGKVLKLPTSAPPKRVVSLSKLAKAFKADPPKAGTPVSYAAVEYVEDALVSEGLLAARFADGHAGTATRSAYSLYQKRLGYSGADADGIPGATSLGKLAKKYGLAVVA
ncbi:LysM peptidoglycan-binding domain-containing protein [Streptomyces sp. NPDC058155]|uniref:LysM peptidoglycan-binding domain-containing protein n=1 Tax=Streptomyces sp. NPDC058155 TaxID=3346359 RepID=UPI0036E270D9